MCCRCNGRSHKSNVCPKRRVVIIAEEMIEEEEREGHGFENDEYIGVEFVEEESNERVNYVL